MQRSELERKTVGLLLEKFTHSRNCPMRLNGDWNSCDCKIRETAQAVVSKSIEYINESSKFVLMGVGIKASDLLDQLRGQDYREIVLEKCRIFDIPRGIPVWQLRFKRKYQLYIMYFLSLFLSQGKVGDLINAWFKPEVTAFLGMRIKDLGTPVGGGMIHISPTNCTFIGNE